ncbi:hypothetical protein KSS87_023414, partial [Heliosperma pusillum]
MSSSADHFLNLHDELLQIKDSELYTGDGSVDVNGKPVLKSKTGNWKACLFILGNECCERLAFSGIDANLVTYLTQQMHHGNASAARIANIWTGTWLMRYCYISNISRISTCRKCINLSQYALFFVGLYLIAVGTGGIKPCVPSFGADQFDDTDTNERIKKGSFFNWFYFAISLGSLISNSLLVWIQENVGWAIGYGIPAVCMGVALLSFFSGTRYYRYQKPGGSPLTRICQVIVASFRKCKLSSPQDTSLLYETSDVGNRKLEHTEGLEFLDKAAVMTNTELKTEHISTPWRLCTITQVEELKILIRLFPIWVTGIVDFAAHAQRSTTFIEQGTVMDRKIGSFTIPAASLATCAVFSSFFWVPIYEKTIIPLARRLTKKERGFSELQRIGIGFFLTVIAMVFATLVETRRLQVAKEPGLVPLSILWQVPQYVLLGISDVFTYVGRLQFLYDQSPDSMRSLCTAFGLLIIAFGFYLSSFVLFIVTSITTAGGKPGWIPDDLNKGQLDNYFGFWAGFSFLNLLVYVLCAI